MATIGLIFAVLLFVAPACGQGQSPGWQSQVRQYAEAGDWNSALQLVNQEVARAPLDMDVRAWRARVLTWSGHLADAEREYVEILSVSRTDPDNWMGLANVYLREGKVEEAEQAIEAAEDQDPKRADLHALRGRILRASGKRQEARAEFQSALNLDPASTEARDGLASLRADPKHELRFGQDNDLLSFSGDYHDEWMTLASRWSSHWTTTVSGDLYQRAGANAGKFVGTITRRKARWGAATIGGAVGHDKGVIPRSEAFFDLGHGWKVSESGVVRSVEFDYGQHWYWYQAARILTVNGTAVVYLPEEWTLSLAATGARSAFTGTNAEWRPSGIARLSFPLVRRKEERLSGSTFFAAGTEDFAIVDQIGRFASHTYGGELKFQISARQDVTGYGGYQKRTQNGTDISFGLSYAIHF